MNTVVGEQEVVLGVFGGLNTDVGATDLPPGLSPYCMDVAFDPGAFYTRPPLKRVSTLGTTTQVVYQHSYIKPDGTVVQLVFDSAGGIYADGVKIGATAPGNRFFAANAFGRAYVAISDGLHGQDVPLQIDQNLNVDRVSQNGPAAPPVVANYSLPAQTLVTGSSGTSVPITTAQPINPQTVQVGGDDGPDYQQPQYATYYTALQVTTSTPHGLSPGAAITISGNSYGGSFYVTQIDSATVFEVSYQSQSNTSASGGTVQSQSPLLVRNNGQVTAYTANPHSLRPGYQVAISGVTDQNVGGSVSSITIDNTKYPDQARIVTTAPHGLVPGIYVTLAGVSNVNVGGGIASSQVLANLATVTTNTPHGLQVGAFVLVSASSSGTPGPFLPFTVTSITSPTIFSYPFNGPNASYTSGMVTLVWPGNQNTDQVFQVQTVDSPTSFFINLTYSNGVWTSGTLTYPWNGVFNVTSVPSATSFTYAQIGPNVSIQSGTGTATPQGQITPGAHKVWLIFRTRQGALTAPSSPVTINAPGNGYLFVTQAATGPTNIVARYLAVSGANSGNAFILPIPPSVNGTPVGTSTVIGDNTTTSAILDFSDAALYSGLGVDIPGGNLFRQEVVDSALGFLHYQGRLLTWGGRNTIQNLINTGFEGGTLTPNQPLGWTVTGSGVLAQSMDYGLAWTPTGDSTISQSAYQDQYGVAIFQAQTQYTFRAWVNGTVTAVLYSSTAGVLMTASITASQAFGEGVFSAKTPVSLPADTVLQLSGGTMDELSFFPTANPYKLGVRASYVNNPEAFDGVTGYLGPDDSHAVRGIYVKRDILSLLTAGPRGSRYEVENTPSGEPSSWAIRRLSTLCGATSVWGQAQFEDWECWVSDTGVRIDLGETEKISQEVQDFFDSINPAYRHLTVLANDPYTRRMYILATTGTATVTNSTMVLDYRELNTAGALANSGTLRISGTGKVLTTDLTRKWCPWSIRANYCGLMTLATGIAEMIFCGCSGGSLAAAGTSATYTLQEGFYGGVDDDYGPFWQRFAYQTYFFVDSDTAQQQRIGLHRVLHGLVTANVEGVGSVAIRPAVNRLDNLRRSSRYLAITPDITRDLEFANEAEGERIGYLISIQPSGPQPFSGTAMAGCRVSSLVVSQKTHPFSPVRGRNY